jgi:hypothetical protein
MQRFSNTIKAHIEEDIIFLQNKLAGVHDFFGAAFYDSNCDQD